jgi:acetyl-CoA synthetase
MATVENPQVPVEPAVAPEVLPRETVPAAASAPAASQPVAEKTQEAPAQETKAPVVAEAHLVDTYRKLACPAGFGANWTCC